jgi:hypothetical protein
MLLAGSAVVLLGVLLLSGATALWLDEAQSVAIARLRPALLFEALRQDGSPPAYYLLLHGWMNVFGGGDTAARALSSLLALPVVPLIYRGGRRIVGTEAALPAALLVGSSPFLLRYATEARMYTLVMLLLALAALATHAVATSSRRRPWLILSLTMLSGALLLTHYWTAFVVATAVVWLAIIGWRRRDPRSLEAAGAILAGGVLFVPWIPSLMFQLQRTGAPWGATPDLSSFEFVVRAFAGHSGRLSGLGFLYILLALVGIFGVASSARRFEIDLLPRHRIPLLLLAAAAVPVTIGIAASALAGSAFAPRYAAIAFLPFALLVARGITVVRPARAGTIALVLIVGLGLLRSAETIPARRTQAPRLAAAITTQAGASDVVVFCPDQLGPAFAREMSAPLRTLTYAAPPPDDGPLPPSLDRVNWIDYGDRMRSGDPEAFAHQALDAAGPSGAVWLVMGTGYRTLGESCLRINAELLRARPAGQRVLKPDTHSFERATLWRYPS